MEEFSFQNRQLEIREQDIDEWLTVWKNKRANSKATFGVGPWAYAHAMESEFKKRKISWGDLVDAGVVSLSTKADQNGMIGITVNPNSAQSFQAKLTAAEKRIQKLEAEKQKRDDESEKRKARRDKVTALKAANTADKAKILEKVKFPRFVRIGVRRGATHLHYLVAPAAAATPWARSHQSASASQMTLIFASMATFMRAVIGWLAVGIARKLDFFVVFVDGRNLCDALACAPRIHTIKQARKDEK